MINADVKRERRTCSASLFKREMIVHEMELYHEWNDRFG